jgi:hypothetical protein
MNYLTAFNLTARPDTQIDLPDLLSEFRPFLDRQVVPYADGAWRHELADNDALNGVDQVGGSNIGFVSELR